MTRENAIICLKGIKNYGRDTFTEQTDWQKALNIAIKALEQESCTDAISRQDAIDALNMANDKGETRTILDVIDVLRELPSAQPEMQAEVQEILQYLDERLHPLISPEHWSVYSELYDMVSMLPSAQPEIIRCKDCKHSEHWYRDKRRCFLWVEDGIDVFDDGFCNYAERRTDG